MKKYKLEPYSVWTRRNTPRNFVRDCYHQGACDADIESYKDRFYIEEKDYDFFRKRLDAYGIDREWDYPSVLAYTLWMMAGDIQEEKLCILGD